MGCTSSTQVIRCPEDSSQCRLRRRWISEAVASRHKFSAAHSTYAQSLKNAGAAFRQFADTAGLESVAAANSRAAPPVFLPPPSPPSPPESPPLRHQGVFAPPPPPTGVPPLPSPPRSYFWDSLFDGQQQQQQHQAQLDTSDDDEDEDEEPAVAAAVISNASVSSASKDLRMILLPSPAAGRLDFSQVISEVDDLFLRAHDCCTSVSKLLEATKVHYHSNFVDSKAFDSHSKRVLQAITWKRGSGKNPKPLRVADDGMNSPDDDGEHNGSHAATLDKLLAWEKKLYQEVKAAESFRQEHGKIKLSVLKELHEEALEKKRSLLKDLELKAQVALKGAQTAIAAINNLKKNELHGQLLRLLEGLISMWRELYRCHQMQCQKAAEMKAIDNWAGIEPTSSLHSLAATQLATALSAWGTAFQELMASQREYMVKLTGWVRLSNEKLETENAAAAAAASDDSWKLMSSLEICEEWSLAMDRLAAKTVVEAIKSLETVVRELKDKQAVELAHREKVDTLTKIVERKSRGKPSKLPKWMQRSKQEPEQQQQLQTEDSILDAEAENRNAASSSSSIPSVQEEENSWTSKFLENSKLSSSTRESSLESAKRLLEEESRLANKATLDARVATMNSMHNGLPSIFQTLEKFSERCLRTYQAIHRQGLNAALLRITQA